MATPVFANGTRVEIIHTFGQRWLQAEYGDEYGRVFGMIVEAIVHKRSYKVKMSEVYTIEVHETELEEVGDADTS